MPSIRQILFVAPAMFAAVAHAQGVITSAQGTKGSPASPPLQVDLTKSDANIINIDEINTNVVNECGRTLLGGNIDVGANTEDQLANKTVTSVTKGSTVSVTIDQLNANGAGPYTCDLDPTGNSIGATGQTNLTTTEKDSNNGIITLSVTMPSDLACMGASTGNVCTVRCFNTAAAGPFGGCFAVQQTDVTANKNTPQNIVTAQTLAGVTNQIAQNQKDLPAAVKSVQDAATVDQQGVLAVDELLNIDSTASATAGVASTSAATAKATSAATGKTGKSGKGTSSKGTTTATTAKGGKNANANANANAKGARAFVA